jgi:hypothetical protein
MTVPVEGEIGDVLGDRGANRVRARTAGSPYAAAFFTLVEGLGVLESPRSG